VKEEKQEEEVKLEGEERSRNRHKKWAGKIFRDTGTVGNMNAEMNVEKL
jgi:hypothetical protein